MLVFHIINMRKNLLKHVLIFFLLWSLVLGLILAYGFDVSGNHDYNRARVLGYMLQQYLGSHHYSHKKIDNDLSKAVFNLYLKQIDPQKRFLLKGDVEKLNVFSDKIDDEINSGKIKLHDTASKILSARAVKAQGMVRGLLSKDFDFSTEEYLETDTEKIDFCKTEEELKERWRKTLKLQTLSRYLTMLEDEASKTESDLSAEKTKNITQETAREKILKGYEEFFSRMLKENETERYDQYFEAFARAFDPHTNYMPPMSKEDFDIGMKGTLEGIGAMLREEDGYIKIASVIPGSPAARQGQVHAEDIILKVAEGKGEAVDVTDMRVRDAVRLIRGKKGTEVRLTLKKQDGTRVTVPIVRDVIQIEETFAKGITLKDSKSGAPWGYIKLPTFYRDFEKTENGATGRNSTDDVRNELKKLGTMNIKGLIIDLRNNGGGALTDAVGIAGLFIKTGPVVQVKGNGEKIKILSDDDPAINYNGPLVILVNKFSASASEILAGALQDYGRAVIIGGDHTHGKGTVQAMIDLNNSIPFQNMEKYKPLGALKVTTQKFYRVSGESTQYRGITPDIILPDQFRCLKSSEQYLDYALPWDTISPTTYTKWTRPVDPSYLKAKSAARVQSGQDFADLEMKSKRICDQQKKTLQSLNIAVVKKEQEEIIRLKEKDGKNIHGHSNKKADDPQLTEDEKKEQWVKEVNEDPYVKEAMSVLIDMASAPSSSPAKRLN